MTGQARVLIRDYGTDIRITCAPCGIDAPDTWPAARATARTHNTDHHPRQIRDA